MTSRMIERMKGIRQPHLWKSAGAITYRQIQMTTSARNRPTVAVVWIQAVCPPRFSSGACSAT